MSVLDTEVLNNTIYRVLENGDSDAVFPSLLTSMFSSVELVDTMNRVQQAFMLATGMIVTRATIPGLANTAQYSTPVNSIRPRRIAWTYPNPNAGWNVDPWNVGPWDPTEFSTRALTQCDSWELDNASPGWPSDQDIPIAWYENHLAQQRFGIAPAPNTNGTIALLYVALATTLTGLGVALTVPDDWTPYVLWGTLADLLESDGQAFDPVRAKYCRQRLDEGIELARIVLGGN